MNLGTKNTGPTPGYAEVSYPKEGNKVIFGIENVSLWFQHRNDLILYLIQRFGLKGDFLDIGGGNGFQAKAIQELNFFDKVILLEPGEDGCSNATERGVHNVFNGFVKDFQFEKFNVRNVGLFDVIEHLEDDISFLSSLFAKIPDRSRVFISVPAFQHLWSQTDEISGHFRRYNCKRIKKLESSTGFKTIFTTYYFNYYYPFLFLLRVLPYRLGIRWDKDKLLQRETKMLGKRNIFTDRFFSYLHNFSLARIEKGKTLPWGTSLFLVLEKSL
ncbi:MAG: hypothetical protein RMJ53_10075 [Chitinophagales bacterium]|nr:hypothetical protein [Chitinophagales bacterium]